jgi:hypothetical protein
MGQFMVSLVVCVYHIPQYNMVGLSYNVGVGYF